MNIWHGWLKNLGEKPGGGADLRTYNRNKKIRDLQKRALGKINSIHPNLVNGNDCKPPNENEIDTILELITKNEDTQNQVILHNFFIEGLYKRSQEELLKYRENSSEWHISLPSLYFESSREKSPFTPESFRELAKLSSIMPLFHESICNSKFLEYADNFDISSNRSKNIFLTNRLLLFTGQIIFSAIVRGGLLNDLWVNELIGALMSSMHIENNILHVEIRHVKKYKNESRTYRRIWYPDSLTGILILKSYKVHNNSYPELPSDTSKKNYVQFALKQYMHSIGLNSIEQPSLSQLIRSSSTKLALEVPSFFVHYATSKYLGPPLTDIAMARLFTNKIPICNPSIKTELSTRDRQVGYERITSLNVPLPWIDQDRKIKKINKILQTYKKHNSRNRVNTELRDMLADEEERLSPMLKGLTGWLLEMMTSKWVTGHKIHPSTAYNYFNSINDEIVSFGGEYNILEIDRNEWRGLYNNVLDTSKNYDSRSYKTQRLRSFHKYLSLSYKEIPHIDIVGIRTLPSIADANVITPTEFKAVKSYIRNNPNQPERSRRIQELIIILGYRCGLRNNEVISLEIRDLQTIDEIEENNNSFSPELIIRNSKRGKLKTLKSMRRIPIKLFLTYEEWTLVKNWKKQRLTEVSLENSERLLLFADTGYPEFLLPYRETFMPINAALKTVTRDSTVHYYTLRHSFISFFFISLLQVEYPNILLKTWTNDGTDNLLPIADATLRKILLRTEKNLPSQRLLYLVSLICGHVDPDETLTTYSHLINWALYHAVEKSPYKLTMDDQSFLLDIKNSSLRTYRSQYNLGLVDTTAADIFKIMASKLQKKFINPSHSRFCNFEPAPTPDVVSTNYTSTPSLSDLYEIFRLHYIKKDSEFISMSFGYSYANIDKWINKAKKYARIETSRGNFRHVPQKKHLDQKSIKQRPHLPGLCPAPPRNKKQRLEAEKIFNKFIELNIINPKLALSGIKIFLNKKNYSKSDIKLPREDMILYCQFLKALGIDKSRLRLSIYPSKMIPEAEQLKFWHDSLDLPIECLILLKKNDRPWSKKKYGNPTLWIASEGNPLDNIRTRENPETWPLYSFNYALFMAAVISYDDQT